MCVKGVAAIEHREKNETYPRKTKEMMKIMKAADREGRLAQVMAEEISHPFSMPALWECREYIYKLPEEVYHQDTRECPIRRWERGWVRR